MIKKIFQDWTYEDVEDIFGIRLIQKDPLAQEWLSAKYDFSDADLKDLGYVFRFSRLRCHRYYRFDANTRLFD